MILLTREEAESVLGVSPSYEHSALEPAPLPSGEYILHEDVLTDLSHADVHDFLASLPTREIPPEENWDFGPMDDPDQAAIDLYNSMRLNWSEGGEARASAAVARTAT